MIYIGKPKIEYIVLHHTAVSREVQPLQKDAVNNHHFKKWDSVSTLGYYGGYNFFCESIGLRTQFRAIGEETIAQIGYNCDVDSRCNAVSYCMAGDFLQEKPTQQQVDDFTKFVKEIKEKYPNVKVVQHKDLQENRTCAVLTDEYLNSIITVEDDKDREIERLKNMILQLIRIVLELTK